MYWSRFYVLDPGSLYWPLGLYVSVPGFILFWFQVLCTERRSMYRSTIFLLVQDSCICLKSMCCSRVYVQVPGFMYWSQVLCTGPGFYVLVLGFMYWFQVLCTGPRFYVLVQDYILVQGLCVLFFRAVPLHVQDLETCPVSIYYDEISSSCFGHYFGKALCSDQG